MERKANRSTKKCCKCQKNYPSATDIDDADNSIVLVEGTKEIQKASKNENEFQLRLWAFMEPPIISSPMPLISFDRVVKVRELLNGTLDESFETHVDSEMSIKYLEDGTVRKVKSVTEYKLYPPILKMDPPTVKRNDCIEVEDRNKKR